MRRLPRPQDGFNTLVRDRIASIRTTIYVDQTIEEALLSLRKRHIEGDIIYIYVVDSEKKLVGVVPTRKLLLSDASARISDVMDRAFIAIEGERTLREAMEFLKTHRLLALPVIDKQGVLLGMIDVGHYFEEKFDVANASDRKDIFQMIGFYIEGEKRSTTWRVYRSRMPWLICNMFGGLTCAILARIFEWVLSQAFLLAMFIPLVLTLSESISMQSMAQSIRLVRGGNSYWKRARSFLREWCVVSMLALSCGLLVGIASLAWEEGWLPSLTIACGIVVSISISALFGAAIPLFLHMRHWDPHVAAGPIVLTCADVFTTSIYFLLGAWWLG